MRHGEHHIHQRKRKALNLGEDYHEEAKFRMLDKIVWGAAIAFPLTSIPQILKIFIEQNAQSISILTWILYVIFTLPLLFYSIVHRVRPLILMNVLWMIVYFAVIYGTVLYG